LCTKEAKGRSKKPTKKEKREKQETSHKIKQGLYFKLIFCLGVEKNQCVCASFQKNTSSFFTNTNTHTENLRIYHNCQVRPPGD
jgi:hypothetical protein